MAFNVAEGPHVHAGSGKTLIAAMLIKHTLEKPEHEGKKVVFLAPTVNLVEQVC